MQNLDVEDAIHKNRKTKAEIKKELKKMEKVTKTQKY